MKIKIIRYEKGGDYCFECGRDEAWVHPASDWWEVDLHLLAKINGAVNTTNRENKDFTYVIIQDITKEEGLIKEIFSSAEDFLKKQKEQIERKKEKELQAEKARQKAIKDRKKKALERKKKQLEKLKKELGE